MSEPQPDLVPRCRAGDEAAWRELVAHYTRRVFGIAYRFVGKVDEAEDLTQDIFVKVYQSLDRYRMGIAPYKTWLLLGITALVGLIAGASAAGQWRTWLMWVNGVSFSQLTTAPPALRALRVGHVPLSTPLAVGAARRPGVAKGEHLVVMGRVTPYKGQAVAARVAHRIGRDLVLAGPVGPHHRPEELHGPDVAEDNPDVRYWREHVEPLVDGCRVRWVGTVAGEERDGLVASARASLVPVDWEEPGGTAVVESLALGTPVVGFRRGCLPELVEHGRTGLLVDAGDEDALAAAAGEAGRLDPDDCRREAARRFTPSRMAEKYLRLYDKVLARSGRPVRMRGAAREV